MENIILEKEGNKKREDEMPSSDSSDFLYKLGYGVPLSESFPPIQTPPPSPIKSDSSIPEERTFTPEERSYLKPYSKEEKNIRSDDLRAHLYPDTEEVIPEGTTWGQMKKNYKKTFGKHIPKYETIEEMEENIYNVESHPIVIGGRKTKRTKKHKKSKTSRKTRKSRKRGKGRKSRKHRKSQRR